MQQQQQQKPESRNRPDTHWSQWRFRERWRLVERPLLARWPYPVALSGLDGLLAGRRARAHAVRLLAVCRVPVALGLVLVLSPDHRHLTRLSREGERAGPAGRGARHGAPEAGSVFLAGAGRGRRQGGEGRRRGDGSRFRNGRGGQGPTCGPGDGLGGGLRQVLLVLRGALAPRTWRWQGGKETNLHRQ